MGLGADSLQERTGGDPHPHSKGEVEMQPGECMASSRRDLIWGWCPWPGDSEAGGGGGVAEARWQLYAGDWAGCCEDIDVSQMWWGESERSGERQGPSEHPS